MRRPWLGLEKERIEMAHVLIAEDEPTVRQSIVLMLTAFGHSVVEASSPREAERVAEVAVAAGRPFELLVVDYNFVGEDQDGVDLVTNYFDQYGLLPAIMLTASKDRDVREEALQAGVKEFVNKPVQSEPMRAAVERALDGRVTGRAVETK
jgi:CheY-like chemotaxis protein